MKPRQQRMLAVGLSAVGILVVALLTKQAFNESAMFFVNVTEVAEGQAPADRNFRVGGLVVDGSVRRDPGELEVEFTLTDNNEELVVAYSGVLPDLFREGQGIIAHGQLASDGRFMAHEVLAKHDETYMPPEVAESLAKHSAAQEAAMSAEQNETVDDQQ